MEYRYECKNCKQIQNIVYDIRKGKRYKVFFGHEWEEKIIKKNYWQDLEEVLSYLRCRLRAVDRK